MVEVIGVTGRLGVKGGHFTFTVLVAQTVGGVDPTVLRVSLFTYPVPRTRRPVTPKRPVTLRRVVVDEDKDGWVPYQESRLM